jgi:hypothetical protein
MTTHLQQYNNLFTTTQLQLFAMTHLQTTYWAICLQPTHLQQHTEGELLACTLPKLWLSLISQLVKSVCTLAHFECCYHVKRFPKASCHCVRVQWHWRKCSKFTPVSWPLLRYPLLTFVSLKTIGNNSFKALGLCYLLLLLVVTCRSESNDSKVLSVPWILTVSADLLLNTINLFWF